MKFELLFDNGGGILLMTADYCHAYDRAGDAAQDIAELLAGGCTENWEGNQPEYRRDQHAEDDILTMSAAQKVYDGEAWGCGARPGTTSTGSWPQSGSGPSGRMKRPSVARSGDGRRPVTRSRPSKTATRGPPPIGGRGCGAAITHTEATLETPTPRKVSATTPISQTSMRLSSTAPPRRRTMRPSPRQRPPTPNNQPGRVTAPTHPRIEGGRAAAR